jgi:hypothetical protein
MHPAVGPEDVHNTVIANAMDKATKVMPCEYAHYRVYMRVGNDRHVAIFARYIVKARVL